MTSSLSSGRHTLWVHSHTHLQNHTTQYHMEYENWISKDKEQKIKPQHSLSIVFLHTFVVQLTFRVALVRAEIRIPRAIIKALAEEDFVPEQLQASPTETTDFSPTSLQCPRDQHRLKKTLNTKKDKKKKKAMQRSKTKTIMDLQHE